MAQNGGKREGAGRKPKADEDKAKIRLLKALKFKYLHTDDEDNVISFLSEFLNTKDGLKFFAEHLIGKPQDKVEHTGELITSIINLGEGVDPNEATK